MGQTQRSRGDRHDQTCRLFIAVEPPAEAIYHLGALVDSLLMSQADEIGPPARLTARDGWHVTLAFLGAVPVTRTEDVTRAMERAVLAFTAPSEPSSPLGVAARRDVLAPVDATVQRDVAAPVDVTVQRDVAAPVDVTVQRDVAAPVDVAARREVLSPVDATVHRGVAELGDVPSPADAPVRRGVTESGDAAARGDINAPRGGGSGDISVCFQGGGTFGRVGFTILWAGLAGDVSGLRRLAAAVRHELARDGLPYDAREFRPHLTISRPGARVAPDLVAADVATLDAYRGPPWTVDALHVVMSDWVDAASGVSPRYTHLSSTALP